MIVVRKVPASMAGEVAWRVRSPADGLVNFGSVNRALACPAAIQAACSLESYVVPSQLTRFE